VLIDEASQATETATCVPVISGCQQLVLVGDHHQLPPTVTSEAGKAEGMEVSLFQRLVLAGVTPLILDTQYRMHPAISQFASDCFYGGRIKDGIKGSARPAPAGIDWPRTDFPVVFIPAPYGSEQGDVRCSSLSISQSP
jgi:regulator of nonsense transcripts 1